MSHWSISFSLFEPSFRTLKIFIFKQWDADLDSILYKVEEEDSLLLYKFSSLSKTTTEIDGLVVSLKIGTT